MNKRVLRTMIILCWVFLVAYAILKLVPQLADKFVIVVNNERVISAGQFIDSHIWLQQILYGFTTLLTYHFYLCACIKKWHLSWKQYIVLCVIIAITNTIKYYLPDYALIINMLIMIIYPFALKGDYRTFVIIFATHFIGQILLGFIRSEPLNSIYYNSLNGLIMCIDAYVWLLLYYLYSNLYKEKKFMGNLMPPLWGKMGKQIESEIEGLDKQIAECQDDKKRAKLQAKREELEKLRSETSNKK